MLLMKHNRQQKSYLAAYGTPHADEVVSAFNSWANAKSSSKWLKVSETADGTPVIHLANQCPNTLTQAWVNLNDCISTPDQANAILTALQEMGAAVSAIDAKKLADMARTMPDGFPF